MSLKLVENLSAQFFRFIIIYMTRFANIPVTIPAGVEFNLSNNKINVKGKLGVLDFEVHHLVKCEQSDEGVFFKPKTQEKQAKALAGTTHRLTQNMIKGVVDGFEKGLELRGVGYRVEQKGNNLILSLGYSNQITYNLPEGISAALDGQTKLTIKGIDKQKVGQVAAEIRNLRRPDPYKGKGVRYIDEVIILKETKKK